MPARDLDPEPRFTHEVLRLATLEDIEGLRALARKSYASGLLPLCIATLDFHEECLRHRLDDGRSLFVFERSGQAIGGCGLHRYIWGPRDVCWGSWFFISPGFRNAGAAQRMSRLLLAQAVSRGFVRMYVEASSPHENFGRLAFQLQRYGFELQATLPGFYAPNVDQLLFRRQLVLPDG